MTVVRLVTVFRCMKVERADLILTLGDVRGTLMTVTTLSGRTPARGRASSRMAGLLTLRSPPRRVSGERVRDEEDLGIDLKAALASTVMTVLARAREVAEASDPPAGSP